MTSKPSKKSKSIPQTISDLLVLPVTLPPLPSYSKPASHYLYLRPDAPPVPTADTPRSLFITDVPITSSESTFRTFFKDLCGAIVARVDFESDTGEDVLAQLGLRKGSEVTVRGTKVTREENYSLAGRKRKRDMDEEGELAEIADEMRYPETWDGRIWKSGGSALIVFVDRATMKSAYKALRHAVKKGHPIPWPRTTLTPALGSARYKRHLALTYPSRSDLTHRINQYLTAFSALEDQRAKLLAKQRSVPDEEGFITVTRGRRSGTGPARLEEAAERQRIHREREEKRKGVDFYRFQTREVRKERERKLKEAYEEDRRRLVEMRKRRGKVRPEV